MMENPTRIWQVTVSDRSKCAKYSTLMGLAQTAADAANRAWKVATDNAPSKVVSNLYVSEIKDMGRADF